MPIVKGSLTDFGLDPLAGDVELWFIPAHPGLRGLNLLSRKPVRVKPAANAYFEANLVSTEAVSPATWYEIELRYLDRREKKVERLPWQLRVPAAGGILADLLKVPSNPALVFTGEVAPPNPAPGSWWQDTTGDLREYDGYGWNFKANLRGPAGYMATGAAEDDAAIAAFIEQTAGPSKAGAAARTAAAAVARPIAEEIAARPPRFRPAQALAVFTFDDGVAADRDFIRPLLNGRQVKGTFGVITNNVGNSGRLSWPDIRQLIADGHEIANHSASHANLNTTDASVITAQIDAAHETFLANGVNPTGFIWAFGASSPASRAAARRIYKYALGGTAGTTQPLHTYAIKRVEITPTSTLASHQAQIDAAKTGKELLIFLVHAADWNGAGFAKIGEVIDYARTAGLPIVTANEAIERMGNVLDTGDLPGGTSYTVISGAGAFQSSSPGTVAWGGAGVSVTATPASFPAGIITMNTFSAPGNDGWPPAGASGTVETHRLGNHIAYTRQIVYTGSNAGPGSVYYRTAIDDTTWSDFAKLDNGNINPTSKDAAALPVTDFPLGSSMTRVTNPGSTGPGGNAGTLFTHRPHVTQHGYAVQEFSVFGSNSRYRRGCSAAGEWLAFEPC